MSNIQQISILEALLKDSAEAVRSHIHAARSSPTEANPDAAIQIVEAALETLDQDRRLGQHSRLPEILGIQGKLEW